MKNIPGTPRLPDSAAGISFRCRTMTARYRQSSPSSLSRLGGRAHADFSGIQSVCSDAVAQTYLTGKPNFSLGCDGSRTFSGINDDETVMGFPAEMLPETRGRGTGHHPGSRVVE